jgi:hypothetical protein
MNIHNTPPGNCVTLQYRSKQTIQWIEGRSKDQGVTPITGFQTFDSITRNMMSASKNDNPYADQRLIAVEKKIEETITFLDSLERDLDHHIRETEALGISYPPLQYRPKNFTTAGMPSPHGLKAISILRQADGMLIKINTLVLRTKYTRSQENDVRHSIGRKIRSLFGSCFPWKFFAVNRHTVRERESEEAVSAYRYFKGPPPDAVLSGYLRPELVRPRDRPDFRRIEPTIDSIGGLRG